MNPTTLHTSKKFSFRRILIGSFLIFLTALLVIIVAGMIQLKPLYSKLQEYQSAIKLTDTIEGEFQARVTEGWEVVRMFGEIPPITEGNLTFTWLGKPPDDPEKYQSYFDIESPLADLEGHPHIDGWREFTWVLNIISDEEIDLTKPPKMYSASGEMEFFLNNEFMLVPVTPAAVLLHNEMGLALPEAIDEETDTGESIQVSAGNTENP